jgi:hypothetical protein
MIILPVVYIIICALIALVGKGKSIGYWGTFFLSLFLSPLVGLIIALASGPKTRLVQPSVNIYQNMPNQQFGYAQQQPENYQASPNHVTSPHYHQPIAQASQGNADTDKYAQVEKLAVMKSKGILTDEEFQREKNRILNA